MESNTVCSAPSNIPSFQYSNIPPFSQPVLKSLILAVMNILITGASAGVGYETALLLAANTQNEILAIARREDRLKSLQQQSLKQNSASKLDYIAGDLSQAGFLSDIEKRIKSKWNSVDVLINNAGLLINKPFEAL